MMTQARLQVGQNVPFSKCDYTCIACQWEKSPVTEFAVGSVPDLTSVQWESISTTTTAITTAYDLVVVRYESSSEAVIPDVWKDQLSVREHGNLHWTGNCMWNSLRLVISMDVSNLDKGRIFKNAT